MRKILITGGCGFIGHHIVEHYIKNTDWQIVVLDKLTYAADGFDRLRDISVFDDKRVTILSADFTQPLSVGIKKEMGDVDYILHTGAETHVDNSIENPEIFVVSNVIGTMHILNYARELPSLKKMLYFSTDEVFGPAPVGTNYKEWDRYNSGNPYSATKAGAEELCLAYHNTYKTPVLISHTMNVFGERQHFEKFIPMIIRKVIRGEEVTIHADKTCTISGSRFYIHARNVANAVNFLFDKGEPGDKYNIVGEKEVSNLEMAQVIAKVIGKDLNYKMVDFHSSRPGHDLRYALDGTKMSKMGWSIPMSFEQSLSKVVKWSLDNPRWIGLSSP